MLARSNKQSCRNCRAYECSAQPDESIAEWTEAARKGNEGEDASTRNAETYACIADYAATDNGPRNEGTDD